MGRKPPASTRTFGAGRATLLATVGPPSPRYCGTAAAGTSDPPQLDPNPAAQL